MSLLFSKLRTAFCTRSRSVVAVQSVSLLLLFVRRMSGQGRFHPYTSFLVCTFFGGPSFPHKSQKLIGVYCTGNSLQRLPGFPLFVGTFRHSHK